MPLLTAHPYPYLPPQVASGFPQLESAYAGRWRGLGEGEGGGNRVGGGRGRGGRGAGVDGAG